MCASLYVSTITNLGVIVFIKTGLLKVGRMTYRWSAAKTYLSI